MFCCMFVCTCMYVDGPYYLKSQTNNLTFITKFICYQTFIYVCYVLTVHVKVPLMPQAC